MIFIVGMGPGHPDYVTGKAIKVIEEADVVLAFGRIAETARHFKDHVLIANTVSEIAGLIKPHLHRQVAVLASGDPGFFGIARFLRSQNIDIAHTVPGLSSFQYMTAQLGMDWQKAAFFSFHGRSVDMMTLLKQDYSIILTDKQTSPERISEILSGEGAEGRIWVGSDLSYPNEVIIERRIGDSFRVESGLNVVIVKIESIEI